MKLIGCLQMTRPWHQAGIVYHDDEDHYQTILKLVHHMFVASAKAVIAGHEINPDFKIGCMLTFIQQHYAATCNPEDELCISNIRCYNTFLLW